MDIAGGPSARIAKSRIGLKKRLLHGTRKQRVPQPEWVTDMKSLLIICAVALLVQSSPVWSQEALPPLKKQPTEEAVLAEHLDALNHCDWNRLLAQYPDDFQMNLPGGEIVKGREAAGKVFAGFCKDRKEGGLKGITFTPQDSVKIGNVFATQWVVTAPFLAEPYKGSDAYIIENGYLRAMVSTFDGNALKIVK
jgi:SnoaL-like domain